MNALQTYFEKTGSNARQLAASIQRSPSTLSRALRGGRNASMTIAMQVEKATGGLVTAGQFLEICLSARRQSLAQPSSYTTTRRLKCGRPRSPALAVEGR